MADTSRLTVDLSLEYSTWLRVAAANGRVSQAAIVRAALGEAMESPQVLARWIDTARQSGSVEGRRG